MTTDGLPFRDIFAGAKHLTELGTGQLLDAQTLFLSFLGGDVISRFSAYQVQTRDWCDSKLVGLGLGDVLGIVCSIVVFAGDTGLGSSHITSDDEVGAAEVLSDDHVLNGFTRSGHVHGVWKVFPEDARVGGFLLQDFVGLVSDSSRNIVGLVKVSKKGGV